MGRGKKEQRHTIGRPQSVLVLPTAGGRAQSIAGVGCGRPDPRIADAAQAEAGAAESVAGGDRGPCRMTWIARRHHGLTAEVDREPLPDGGRAGRVREGVAR
ncbi:hypothetical protein ACGFYQ_20035 [Streptomyces sp. NPDC048258]|uniref:hypothetical protein n=1 Tax=Streptomyces sp. NPDC048258 TaxID=3365527 RepID=UPI003723AF84